MSHAKSMLNLRVMSDSENYVRFRIKWASNVSRKVSILYQEVRLANHRGDNNRLRLIAGLARSKLRFLGTGDKHIADLRRDERVKVAAHVSDLP